MMFKCGRIHLTLIHNTNTSTTYLVFLYVLFISLNPQFLYCQANNVTDVFQCIVDNLVIISGLFKSTTLSFQVCLPVLSAKRERGGFGILGKKA